MEGEKHNELKLVSFIRESYDDLSKVRYVLPIFWLLSVEGKKPHEPLAGEFHLRKL